MNIGKILNLVMNEYLEEDEETIKKLKKRGNTITFTLDLIDSERFVTIHVKDSNKGIVEYWYDDVRKEIENPSFKDFLKTLMDGFIEERNKKIEYYSELETPTPGVGGGVGNFEHVDMSDEDEMEGEESDDEEEGEEGEVILDVGDGGGWNIEETNGDATNMALLREAAYEILTPTKLIEMQGEAIKKVSETMYVNSAGSKIILRAYRWEVERIMNTFLKSGKEKVLQDVGLSSQNFENKCGGSSEDPDPNAEFECPSCLDDVPYKDTTMLEACGHRFCNTCWERHLTIKIRDGLSKRILCMGYKCQCAVDENIVSRFIKDKEVKKKYDTKVLESFVEDNARIKWCQSAPHCGNAAFVRINPKTAIECHCDCGKSFCFNCLDEPHNPATCMMMEAWKKKCADDSETLNWIKSNTRDCPKCGKATEKNGGCNHISCSCGAHWCWACGGLFDARTVYSHACNKFLEKGGDSNANESRVSLERYLHYFNRYNAHHSSLKNQKKMEMKVSQKIRKMYKTRPNSAWVEIEWLTKGMKVLFETRRGLMFSYVFAYYLFDKGLAENQKIKILKGCKKFKTEKEREAAKNLYEDTQEQLEHTTERLSYFMDLPLEKMLSGQTKKEIMSKSVLNEKRLHGLFDIIREELILEGEIELPEPRYIVTTPSYDQGNLGKSTNFMYGGGASKRPKEDQSMKRAIENSLKDNDDQLLQEALLRSLEER